MKKVLGDTPVEYFKEPDKAPAGKPVLDGNTGGEITVKVDKISGLLATEFTPPELVEERTFKSAHSILYYVNKDDPRGKYPEHPQDDPQFNLWESAVLNWAGRSNFASSTPPTESDNVHRPENLPQINVANFNEGQTVSNPNLTISVNPQAPRGIAKVEYYFDGVLASAVNQYPFNFNGNISFLANGYHKLTIRACDDAENCSSADFNLIASFGPR
jgi:hypothetical protein